MLFYLAYLREGSLLIIRAGIKHILKKGRSTACFIDLGKLNLLKISFTWSESVKQTLEQWPPPES